jgi:flavin reductase (DIM6/NTAB) family NADH-FMN oxidoreductase RutF
MRRYSSGISVVTVEFEGDRFGSTMGSLVSLSLEPPLVGVSVGRQNSLHEPLRHVGVFGVSILAADQERLAWWFARSVPPIAQWEGIGVRPGPGPPLLEGALGWMRCRVEAEHGVGDHTLFVGAVEALELGADGQALVYRRSSYGPA